MAKHEPEWVRGVREDFRLRARLWLRFAVAALTAISAMFTTGCFSTTSRVQADLKSAITVGMSEAEVEGALRARHVEFSRLDAKDLPGSEDSGGYIGIVRNTGTWRIFFYESVQIFVTMGPDRRVRSARTAVALTGL